MNSTHHKDTHIIFGVIILLIPITALLYKFGAWKTFLTTTFVLAVYFIAKLAVYFLRSETLQISMLFLPKHLGQKLADIKKDDKNTDNI